MISENYVINFWHPVYEDDHEIWLGFLCFNGPLAVASNVSEHSLCNSLHLADLQLILCLIQYTLNAHSWTTVRKKLCFEMIKLNS